MRRLALLFALIVVPLALAATGIARADGATTFTEVTIKGTSDPFVFVDPCTGATELVTIEFNSVFHSTERPVSTFMLTNTTVGDFVLVPISPAGPTVTGHFSTTFTIAGGANDVLTNTLNVKGVDANGERVVEHFLQRLTESATGLVVDFTKCG